jgi:hypothetical protein
VLLGGFGLIAWRRESLRAEATFDTPLSRESVFLGNNVLLLVLTFTVLIGTIYPLLAEASAAARSRSARRSSTGNTAPVALLLLFLMGIGPLLPVAGGLGVRRPAPAAGPDVGRRGDRGHPGADRGRGGGGDRVRAGGVRRHGDGRRDGPRRPGATSRARDLGRRGDPGGGVEEPPALRRARRAPSA